MSTRSICNCDKTFSALNGLGAALFVNLAFNFRYFASLFVIPRMFRSLSPEKPWAALKQIFLTQAAFVSSNVLLADLRVFDILSTYNHFHYILRLFDVLPNLPFTTSETMCYYYL